MKVGVIGLGHMDAPTAANLVKAGHQVSVFNRTPGRAGALIELGAPLAYKDVRLALAAAESLRVPMPLGSFLHDRFLRLLVAAGEHLDWAAPGGLATQDAGGAPR
jgi:3-hydroxyisobutyrate dehydrogenase-like beta-hydroxyacid dehydrogenase